MELERAMCCACGALSKQQDTKGKLVEPTSGWLLDLSWILDDIGLNYSCITGRPLKHPVYQKASRFHEIPSISKSNEIRLEHQHWKQHPHMTCHRLWTRDSAQAAHKLSEHSVGRLGCGRKVTRGGKLVGGLVAIFLIFPWILGISNHPLIDEVIFFQRGFSPTTNQEGVE